ncbi:hypothetical protein [Streptomyces sp. NPDC059015]|uniref:hypothetical protein n=1 Tax=unclassified Streptomyces TaxID=2593676 RepID=UPI0036AA3B26
MDDDGRRILDNIRFYSQILQDAERTIYCPPDQAAAVSSAIEGEGLGHVYTVTGSCAVPDGRIILVDEQALEAATRQAAQKPIRFRP